MTGLLACLPMTHLDGARESAQRTYDRRRARSAADTLATIPPNRWDDETRRIIATLATISSPSRIDDALEAFDGPDVTAVVDVGDGTLEKIKAFLRADLEQPTIGPLAPAPPLPGDEYDPGPVPADYDMPSPYDTPDIRVAMAGELRRMGLMDDEPVPGRTWEPCESHGEHPHQSASL